MTVKYIFYMLIFVLLSCGQKTNDFYQGVVLDEDGRPIENVRVFEVYRKENSTKTDNKGYFKLNRIPNWHLRLVFVKEGYITDTIPTVWSQHGERVDYHFIQNDTTKVRLRNNNPNNTIR